MTSASFDNSSPPADARGGNAEVVSENEVVPCRFV